MVYILFIQHSLLSLDFIMIVLQNVVVVNFPTIVLNVLVDILLEEENVLLIQI